MSKIDREKTIFDLEQELLVCWNILDELKVLADNWIVIPDEERLNIVRGLKSLYMVKFDTLYSTYEVVVADRTRFIEAAKNLQQETSYERALNEDYAQDLINNYTSQSSYPYPEETLENEF